MALTVVLRIWKGVKAYLESLSCVRRECSKSTSSIACPVRIRPSEGHIVQGDARAPKCSKSIDQILPMHFAFCGSSDWITLVVLVRHGFPLGEHCMFVLRKMEGEGSAHQSHLAVDCDWAKFRSTVGAWECPSMMYLQFGVVSSLKTIISGRLGMSSDRSPRSLASKVKHSLGCPAR